MVKHMRKCRIIYLEEPPSQVNCDHHWKKYRAAKQSIQWMKGWQHDMMMAMAASASTRKYG